MADHLPVALTTLHRLFRRVYAGQPRNDPRCIELVYFVGGRTKVLMAQFALIHALFAAMTTSDEIQVAALDHDTYTQLVNHFLSERRCSSEVRDFVLACHHLQWDAYQGGPHRQADEFYSSNTLRALPMSVLLFDELFSAAPERLLKELEVLRYLAGTPYGLFMSDVTGQPRLPRNRPVALPVASSSSLSDRRVNYQRARCTL